ncbi:YutD family protein [Vagococcus lutrae]|uniref:YutD family protein n=1 Tax=Vagococcus lutrae TaxID=81947 RepID=UPI00288CDA7E|nr:YutD family protein [Vagococcus lutrae]MDT2802329.1 YutD family protein [Vagococcus lutrae]MDT2826609.1 YutD family protein [Vagococcus lutrae]MDT2842826.1 YutD family protein [Vagococcus lutrae]
MTEKNIQEVIDEQVQETVKEPLKYIEKISDTHYRINQDIYELVKDYRESFDMSLFDERYSDILRKYDFIVGDMGYEQLRLKGFFHNHKKRTPVDQRIETLADYLYEYCNFGCAYFVLEKIQSEPEKKKKAAAHIDEKKQTVSQNKNKRKGKIQKKTAKKQDDQRKEATSKPTRNFTIRQTDEKGATEK